MAGKMTDGTTDREPLPGILHARCRYVRARVRCDREAMRGWTTCPAHGSAGMSRRMFARLGIVTR